MKKLVTLVTISILIMSCSNKSNESQINELDLKKEAKDLFKSISSLPYEDLPENYQKLNNPVTISSIDMSNTMSEKAALGKLLYFDKSLSKDRNISCNSCHNLDSYGVDNLPTSPGDEKKLGGRNSPSVLYASLHSAQFWDGRAKDVEEQAGMPILNPVEHNIPSQEFLVNRLKSMEKYQQLFKKVFPKDNNPISYQNLTNAIGAFERRLIPTSRFDKWLDGDSKQINEQEKKGLRKFIDNGCVACHNGIAIGGQSMQKFGVHDSYWKYTKSKKVDNGLSDITKNNDDQFKFKAPSLRNIEKTYPYFHDGSVNDLKEAVKIMSKVQNDTELSDEEIDDIVAFLKTLTADIDKKYKD